MNTQAVEFIAAFSIGLLLLFMLIRLFYTPLKLAFKLFLNAISGGVILFLINLAGSLCGIYIGINAVTCAIAGVLGIPGISLLLFLQILLGT